MYLRSFRFVRVGLIMACGGVALVASATSEPQRIYRCGNAYTNQPDPAANCKPLAGGSVTVIEGTKVQGAQAAASSTPNSPQAASVTKVDGEQQRQRDVQAQTVLHAELQRAQKRYADLLREWNNGEPERRADEHRQPQKYQDRAMQLRQALQRTEADIAGLQRELSRESAGVKP
jgi:flagellar biosynthesis GTPase FlhF